MAHLQPQTWPGTAGESIQSLIAKLREVDTEDRAGKRGINRTPYSLQVLRAGATTLSQLWAALVAAAGGLPALWAIIQGLRNDFDESEPLVAAAFVVSGSVLLSTVVIAIAMIVKGDVAGRALASAAQKQAEASIAAASLSSYQYAQASPPPIGPYLLKKTDGTVLQVDSFGISNGSVQISSGGQVVNMNEIDYMFDSRRVKP